MTTCLRSGAAALLSLSLLVACGNFDATGVPAAASFQLASSGSNACQPFSAVGTTHMVFPPAGPPMFQGVATVRIGSSTFEDVAVTTTLTGLVGQGQQNRGVAEPAGAQVVTTAHIFDFGGGDRFWTEDIARLVPTNTPGVSRLLSTLRITGGTGAFAAVADNRNPRFTGDQTSTMTGTVASWSFDARLCGYSG